MKQLFLGSEGTLGVITAATLRLYPDPGEMTTLFLALPSAQSAVRLLAQMRDKLADRIQAFEIMSDRCMRFVERHIPDAALPVPADYPWYSLCDIVVDGQRESLDRLLLEGIEAGTVSEAVVAKNAAEAERFWRLRHSLAEAQKPEGESLKHDISVPIAAIGEFLERGDELLESMAPDARLVAFGHVGDGNLHYDVTQPVGADGTRFMEEGAAVTDAIYELVSELGGSISAEHGIGVTKREYLQRYRGGAEIALMRALKSALDPNNILNPGKVI